ncbi:5'/3'-nucleotidase sure [Microthyrium microscopicum]|uniref:5'/3'-nucleotidase sure n=1 Tax=Microthyrium microscopicum TaxID=703497 RepID=A0A6A6UH18_9PEZI|nr:5'/3'-nucleotidase sure [Microthyrium microscopicum]
MKIGSYARIATVALLSTSTTGLNILLGNDDSWASANIRQFYSALKAAGHKVLLVAPAVNQSGKGGTTVFAESANLTGPAEFNTVKAGAPSWGTDPTDSNIWYYNGTPAACTFFALDYVIPKAWNSTLPDLFVSGPNEGNNLGPFLYTLSGTIGAAYAAIERGIPGIAFSAGNGTHRSYTTVANGSTTDVAVLNAKAAVKVVNQLASSVKSGRLLPYGYGINVNLPVLNSTCSTPTYTQTRLTGGALGDKAVLNTTTNVFTYGNDVNDPGLNTCINGNCSLPGETDVVATKCSVALSPFTIDYDAPSCNGATDVRGYFSALVANANTSTAASGTSGNGTTVTTGAPAQQTTNAGAVVEVSGLGLLAGGVAALMML